MYFAGAVWHTGRMVPAPPDHVAITPCDACVRTRVVATSLPYPSMFPSIVRVEILEGCEPCEGSWVDLVRVDAAS